MPAYGSFSKSNLVNVHPKLVRVANRVVLVWDNTITDGARTVAEQRQNVAKGVSKTMDSKHIIQPDGFAHALDANPYPVNWDAIQRGYNAVKNATGGMEVLEMYAFAAFFDGCAWGMGINLRSGYDWNTNRQFEDQTFLDLPHHELRDSEA